MKNSHQTIMSGFCILAFLLFFSINNVNANTIQSNEAIEQFNDYGKKKKRYKANGYKRCKMAKQRDRKVSRIMKKARRQAKR